MDFRREPRGRLRVTLISVAAFVSSAVLFYFGTGLAPIGLLTWLAPLPVFLLAPRVPGWVAVLVGFAAPLLGTANTWSFQLHSHDEPMFPIGISVDLGTAAVFAFVVWVFRTLIRRRRALLAAFTAPALWTGAWYLASLNPDGIMGSFANDQGDQPVVLQTATVLGMWGVEFLVMFAPAALAALFAPGVSTGARVRTGAIGGVLLVVALGGGALRMSTGTGASARVAAIASNTYAWGPRISQDLVASYVRQIQALPADVTTVVLPEAAFGAHQPDPPELVGPMRQVAAARGMNIVLGLMLNEGKPKYNLAMVFPAGGGAPLSYLKHHDMVSRLGHALVFVPGTSALTGVAICHDLDFLDPSRAYAATGNRLLTVPAADGDENGWQHSRSALVHSMENGESIVFSDQNGTLMIADGWGRVLTDAHTGGTGQFVTLTADLAAGPGATPYTRFGDWFAWLCLAISVAGLIAAHPKTVRRDRPDATRQEKVVTAGQLLDPR